MPKQENFFRTMTAQEYRNFSQAIQQAPQPKPAAAAATYAAVKKGSELPLRESVQLPT